MSIARLLTARVDVDKTVEDLVGVVAHKAARGLRPAWRIGTVAGDVHVEVLAAVGWVEVALISPAAAERIASTHEAGELAHHLARAVGRRW